VQYEVGGGAVQAATVVVGGGGVLGPNNPQPLNKPQPENKPLNSPHPAVLVVPVGTRRTCQVYVVQGFMTVVVPPRAAL
jgi:hypothetical protein